MALARKRVDPVERLLQRVAKRANPIAELDEALGKILAETACPNCGYRSLVLDDPKMLMGIVIYCERAFCSWKPFNRLVPEGKKTK